MIKRLGLIINPIAGMGGRIGLKGSDDPDIVERARALGVCPHSGMRASVALGEIRKRAGVGYEILTAPGEMGEDHARSLGFSPIVIGRIVSGSTSYRDTETIASEMKRVGLDLLLFAGGDGTARNICNAVGTSVPALGIPSGVKMHSSVFAATPADSGSIVEKYLRDLLPVREREVMDIDERLFREGIVAAKLYGYLMVPDDIDLVQGTKVGGFNTGSDIAGIAADVAERIANDPNSLYVIGPGSTTKAIMDKIGLPCTLLGADVVRGRELVAKDAGEAELLEALNGQPVRIVVTPIGGQGYVFGRGNQQISPRVIRLAGRENVIVVSTLDKIASFRNGYLLVDTGDDEVDRMLSGSIRVITGYHSEHVCRIKGRH